MKAPAAPPTEERFLLHDVDWKLYDTLLEKVGDRHVFVTYDRGDLEIMSPSREHELSSKLIARLVEALTEELDVPISSGRSTTFRREDLDRGLEPDECYWIQNEARVRGKATLDLAVDPPPDLAIEVEISRRLLDREGIYAALGVPELWRYEGKRLRVLRLVSGRYRVRERSACLPMLPVAQLERFLGRLATDGETGVVRAFRAWVRENLAAAPRPRPRRRSRGK